MSQPQEKPKNKGGGLLHIWYAHRDNDIARAVIKHIVVRNMLLTGLRGASENLYNANKKISSQLQIFFSFFFF